MIMKYLSVITYMFIFFVCFPAFASKRIAPQSLDDLPGQPEPKKPRVMGHELPLDLKLKICGLLDYEGISLVKGLNKAWEKAAETEMVYLPKIYVLPEDKSWDALKLDQRINQESSLDDAAVTKLNNLLLTASPSDFSLCISRTKDADLRLKDFVFRYKDPDVGGICTPHSLFSLKKHKFSWYHCPVKSAAGNLTDEETKTLEEGLKEWAPYGRAILYLELFEYCTFDWDPEITKYISKHQLLSPPGLTQLEEINYFNSLKEMIRKSGLLPLERRKNLLAENYDLTLKMQDSDEKTYQTVEKCLKSCKPDNSTHLQANLEAYFTTNLGIDSIIEGLMLDKKSFKEKLMLQPEISLSNFKQLNSTQSLIINILCERIHTLSYLCEIATDDIMTRPGLIKLHQMVDTHVRQMLAEAGHNFGAHHWTTAEYFYWVYSRFFERQQGKQSKKYIEMDTMRNLCVAQENRYRDNSFLG